MRIIKLALVFAALTLFIIACSQPPTTGTNTKPAANTVSNAAAPQAEITPATTDDLASARKIYSEQCVKCHKEDGLGGAQTLDDGTRIKAPNFTSARMRKDKDADWIETINNGAKEEGMPAYKGKLSDDEIKDLVKYIHREFQK